MAINSQHVTGFLIGLGVAAAGFVLYKSNQKKVDGFLRAQGISVPGGDEADLKSLSLEDLVGKKEQLEDLIAEREYEASQGKKPEAAAE
jgi:hypothetical protein